ncbi:DUF6498-containing protein [Halorussus lipolyticus]|uniref:DUF6498-containing protein n=1 Tax=Halorussus lipolyticus TaxID=3034024 RepID=UPI0023E8516A|nr:DUF6498-containing protein [Halorussus sp. DT80]
MDEIRNSTVLGSPRVAVGFVTLQVLPLVGLVFGGWTLDTLGALYWLEIGVVLCWSLVKSLFAERVFEFRFRGPGIDVAFDGLTEKRGGISVAAGLPPVYPRNVPNVLPYVTAFAWFWLVLGAVVVTSPFALPGWMELVTWQTAGLLTTASVAFLARGLEASDVYLGERQYETCSVVPLNHGAIEYSVVVGLLALLTGVPTDETATLFGVLVAVKFGYELLRHRPGKLHRWDNPLTRLVGGGESRPDPEYLDFPAGAPDVSASPDGRTVRLGSVVYAVFSDLMVPFWVFFTLVGGFGLLAALAAGEVYETPVQMALLLVPVTLYALVALVPLKIVEYRVHHDSMTYEIRDRELVGYDDRLDETQWRIGFAEITNVSLRQNVIDRRADTQTLEIEVGDRTERLVHLADADADALFDRLRHLGA